MIVSLPIKMSGVRPSLTATYKKLRSYNVLIASDCETFNSCFVKIGQLVKCWKGANAQHHDLVSAFYLLKEAKLAKNYNSLYRPQKWSNIFPIHYRASHHATSQA